MRRASKKLAKLIRDPKRFLADSAALGGLVPTSWAKPDQRDELDALFVHDAAEELLRRVGPGELRYLYVPWIGGHTNALMRRLAAVYDGVQPLELFRDADRSASARGQLSRFAKRNPAAYRRVCLAVLGKVRSRIKGVLFSLDWPPPMRQMVLACRELGIPTILVPHESVFRDRNLYYRDLTTGVDRPECDQVLAWGNLQRDVFVERGYPPERIHITGSPKLDAYHDYSPALSRSAFFGLYGLEPSRPLITLATQPFDILDDRELSQTLQQRMIEELLQIGKSEGWQLLVRLPPNRDPILNSDTIRRLEKQPHFACDYAPLYLTSPEETLFHSDVVCSANSTMLLEAALISTPSIAVTYGLLKSFWGDYGCPVAESRAELHALLRSNISSGKSSFSGDSKQAASDFSIGQFDGQAVRRVQGFLQRWELTPPAPKRPIEALLSPVRRANNSDRRCFRAMFYSELAGNMSYLPQLLDCQDLATRPSLAAAAQCDFLVSWGTKPSRRRNSLRSLSKSLGLPLLHVEDGLLRSIGVGLAGEPGLSIMIDNRRPAIDSRYPSQLEDYLNSNWSLSEDERQRVARCIEQLTQSRMSKYNAAPTDVTFEPNRLPAVLIVDQRFNDQSVVLGQADASSFEKMLVSAAQDNPRHLLVVKQHPDAIGGHKKSYYAATSVDEILARNQIPRDRVQLVSEDWNPHALMDQVDRVYVVSSTFGLEALWRNKPVHCFGMPFYAGWGATEDQLTCTRRSATRSIEELFHAIYLVHSLYFSPSHGPCELEQTAAYLTAQRQTVPRSMKRVISEFRSTSAALPEPAGTTERAVEPTSLAKQSSSRNAR